MDTTNRPKAHLAFTGSICLTDIPKETIKIVEKNGKKYLSIAVLELTEPSKYGDTHFISCAPKKDERIEGRNYIIGNLRTWHNPEQVSQADINAAPTLTEEEQNDLPF